jgi:hypothetical protein
MPMYILATLTANQSTVRSIYMVQCVLHLLSSLQNRPVLMQNAQSNESNGFRLLLLSLACLGSFGRFVVKTRRIILLSTPDLTFHSPSEVVDSDGVTLAVGGHRVLKLCLRLCVSSLCPCPLDLSSRTGARILGALVAILRIAE